MYESILIHVNYFQPGDFWMVAAFAYVTDAGPDDPEAYGDGEDFRGDSEDRAVAHAETWAKYIIERERVTKRVTILKNGNEHQCLTA